MYLIDTHVLLWMLFKKEKLSDRVPPIHSDPFDRMIIAQAMTEKLTIITRDEKIHQYPVSTIW